MTKRSNDLTFINDDGRFRVVLTAAVVERICDECSRSGDYETGGILAGSYSRDKRSAVVTHMSAPPSDSKRGRSWLVRGISGLKEWLLELWSSRVYYIGEWHFHPGHSPAPSSVDVEQLLAVSSSRQYACPEPVLVILGGDPKGRWEFHVSVHVGERMHVLREE